MPHSLHAFLNAPPYKTLRANSRERLLAARNTAGHWTGHLTSSALATATAINALRLIDSSSDKPQFASLIRRGCDWLLTTQLQDGSWGDTPTSQGNLSTTLLAWSALAAAADTKPLPQPNLMQATERAAQRIIGWAGDLSAKSLSAALATIYGRDRTFSVPILTHLLLADCFGDYRTTPAWKHVPQLPFELAALPQAWFRLVNLQVVSYALPALIAIGQVRQAHLPTPGPAGWVRRATRHRAMAVLEAIQPANGGFLEATPLTSFVAMSLAAMRLLDHPVTQASCHFLVNSVRPDGSWPIDTNLATWNTTAAVAAVGAGGQLADHIAIEQRAAIRDWLLSQQWRKRHPYTGASPGGWAWTDLAGGVPDADDTSGAIAALAALEGAEAQRCLRTTAAATEGLAWLARLANHDGGLPTFCRGWGRLPFDTSCPDITAHFLRAADAWPCLASEHQRQLDAARRYLHRTQCPDGSWEPLWFGNEHHHRQANPTYGTAKVLLATRDPQAANWLITAQHSDGGVGGGPGLRPTIEETALTVEALAAVLESSPDPALASRAERAAIRGITWLSHATEGGSRFPAAPIGLYFAKLWYAEELYPLIYTVAACERLARLSSEDQQ